MTYTETQLEAIRLFGKKDLTKWNICLMNNKNKLFPDAEDTLLTFFWFVDWEYFFIDEHLNQYFRYTENFEILWHIPHLEDLFRYIENNNLWLYELDQDSITILNGNYIEYDPTLPLLSQAWLPEIIKLFENTEKSI